MRRYRDLTEEELDEILASTDRTKVTALRFDVSDQMVRDLRKKAGPEGRAKLKKGPPPKLYRLEAKLNKLEVKVKAAQKRVLEAQEKLRAAETAWYREWVSQGTALEQARGLDDGVPLPKAVLDARK